MSEKLDRILDYCDLLSRAGSHTLTDSADLTRFERLKSQLVAAVPSLDERDPYTLLAEPLPAQVVFGSGPIPMSVNGQLRNASASGIALSVDGSPPSLGESVKVTARDLERGVEYTFTGTVVSRVVKGGYSMAIALQGAPVKARLGGRSGVFARGSKISEIPAAPSKRSNDR